MPDKKIELLAGKIEAIFCRGFILNSDVSDFIDSTFSMPSFNELKEIISDDANCERDSLVELIFFPDKSIQIQLEDFLCVSDFEKKDEEKIVRLLVSKRVEAKIVSPGEDRFFSIEVPASAVKQFVTRLNISIMTDARLLETISRHVIRELQIPVRVSLRHTRFEYNETIITFMCSFFRKMISDEKSFISCLEFVLAWLDELKGDNDIHHSLMKKKRVLNSSLMKARRFETQLEKNNIETLMLKGVRNPCINTKEVLQTLSIIDRISMAVFGRTEYFEHMEHDTPWNV